MTVTKIAILVQTKESQVYYRTLVLNIGMNEQISYPTVACDAPRFCCSSGLQGDQECLGQCIFLRKINNGDNDCSNGSDEKGNN